MNTKFQIKFALSIALFTFLFSLSSFNPKRVSDYDIVALYNGTDLKNGCKAVTDDGLKDASIILVPTSIRPGKYVVNVTRKGKDIYKVDDKNIYIETRYCYEYSSGQEVVLNIESSYGYSIGKITF